MKSSFFIIIFMVPILLFGFGLSQKESDAAEKQKVKIAKKQKQKAGAIKKVTGKKQAKTENKKTEAEKKGEPKSEAGVEKEDRSERKIEKKVSLERKIEIAQAAKHMKTRTDDQQGIKWYHDKNSPLFMDTGSFQIYFGLKDDSKPLLRLRVQYQGKDWLFIRSFTIIADNNEFREPAVGFNRDKGQTRAWEWYDESLTKKDIEIIQAIIYSSRAVVILKGAVDEKPHVITSAEKESMKNVLDAYLAVGGEL